MEKKVLFVDDDRILRRMVQKKLEKYTDTFSVLTAEDGLDAVKKLKDNTISIAVTDLQMPQMDGFALLAHLSEKYPDIPVIIQTGYGTPKSKRYVLERGAAGFIEKPFQAEKLAQKIIATLKKESEGGILQTIPLEMFTQLIEMERKTCTIRVVDKMSGNSGVLFFRNGDLMEARIGGQHGKPAAYELFSWDQVTLSIQDDCAIKEKRIDQDLQLILFEAMRLKDEAGKDEEEFSEELVEDYDLEDADLDFSEPKALPLEDIIRHKLENALGERECVKEIYQDDSWTDLVIQASEIGKFLEAGALRSCYIDRGESSAYIVLPGKKNTVISVENNCPLDRMLQALK